MNFDNAHDGIRKLIIAQFLGLCAAATGLLSTLLSSLPGVGGSAAAFGAGVLMVITAGLGIASIVVTIIGLVKAKSDEINFNTAFMFTVIGLGCSLAANAFNRVPVLSGLSSIGSTVCSLIGTVYVIKAIMALAEIKGETAIAEKGSLLIKIVVVAKALAVGFSLTTNFFPFLGQVPFLTFIISTSTILVEIVVYLVFLRYLIAGREMLER